jgi:hypothetical protein
MAESGRSCVGCGHLIQMFSGISINGAAYHIDCWDSPGEPAPRVRPTEGAQSDRPAARARVMPAVVQLQLGV